LLASIIWQISPHGFVFSRFFAISVNWHGLCKAWSKPETIRQSNRQVQEDKMIKFDKTDVQRMVVSTLGAFALSATCILAAAGPVKAADLAPTTVQQIHFAAK
jgi:hypothetical protein